MKYYLMGIEFNDIWKLPDFYVSDDENGLHTANDDIEEATLFDYECALIAKRSLQIEYSGYTWYIVMAND